MAVEEYRPRLARGTDTWATGLLRELTTCDAYAAYASPRPPAEATNGAQEGQVTQGTAAGHLSSPLAAPLITRAASREGRDTAAVRPLCSTTTSSVRPSACAHPDQILQEDKLEVRPLRCE